MPGARMYLVDWVVGVRVTRKGGAWCKDAPG